MNKEEYRCGLWKKEAKSGTKYCTGKLKIGDREYQLTLFNNDKKGNKKAPDFNLIVRNYIISQEKKEQVKKEQINNELEQNNNPLRDEVFENFGQFVVEDTEIPF